MYRPSQSLLIEGPVTQSPQILPTQVSGGRSKGHRPIESAQPSQDGWIEGRLVVRGRHNDHAIVLDQPVQTIQKVLKRDLRPIVPHDRLSVEAVEVLEDHQGGGAPARLLEEQREVRSLRTISIPNRISLKLPVMVISSNGHVI